PGDEAEAELAEIASLDLPHLARHQVVMEELHEGRLEPCSPICPSTPAGLSTRFRWCRPCCWRSSTCAGCGRCEAEALRFRLAGRAVCGRGPAPPCSPR